MTAVIAKERTLVEILRTRAEIQPDQRAYTFLVDGEREEVHLTYGELDQKARAIAAQLQEMTTSGDRALLLYPPGLDFIAGFFGCLYAGVAAVPTYPPRRNRENARLQAVAQDAQPQVILAHGGFQTLAGNDTASPLTNLPWLFADANVNAADRWREPAISAETLAFLQYTSGSTGDPKGVMISHGNLLYNEEMIRHGFGHDEQTLVVGWLPLFHDMGLIGNMLQPMYLGIPCILMAPEAFIHRPMRWLQAITHYNATTSGAPNFAYDLCVQLSSLEDRENLDLSSWDVAYCGAEPVRAETIDRFVETFSPHGFRREAFYPCYGMAESTLFISGGLKKEPPIYQTLNASTNGIDEELVSTTLSKTVVGCGRSWLEQNLRIVDPESLIPCTAGQTGEVWTAGPHIAQGYWNRPDETEETFHACLADSGEGPFLRTGDLGFMQDGELFVTGRIKDLIIIRGRNHYPQDIELTVEQCHATLQPHSGAAFAVDVDGEERLVVVQEVKRTARHNLDAPDVFKAIRQAVSANHALETYAVVLLKPGGVPKTTSGKIQRRACREKFLAGELSAISANIQQVKGRASNSQNDVYKVPDAESRETATFPVTPSQLEELLRSKLAELLSVDPSEIDFQQPINSLGLGSLNAMTLKGAIETDLDVTLPVEIFFEDRSVYQVINQIFSKNETVLRPSVRHRNGTSVTQSSGHSKGNLPLPGHRISDNLNRARVNGLTQSGISNGTDHCIRPSQYHLEAFPEIRQVRQLMHDFSETNPYFRIHDTTNCEVTCVCGQEFINYSSYNYLGMSGDTTVSMHSKAAIDQYGTSVSASRVISGEIPIHHELESELAGFIGTEDCVVYVGGFTTNVTTIGHLMGPQDLILHDEIIHNCAIQGAKLSGATARSFLHNDWQALDAILQAERTNFRRVLIIIEGVYSMDGDIPDLPRFIEVKQRHKALLMIDEAHSIGTIGATGRGIGEHFSVNPADVDIWMGTLSKSFASCGGYIAGSKELVDYLKYTAPGFVYSVGISPPNTASALAAVRLLRAEPERVAQLRERSKLFLELARARGINTGMSQDSPVVPVIVGDSQKCMALSQRLFDQGISVMPIIFPAVAEDAARLRFFLSCTHTEEQIRTTVDAVAEELAVLGEALIPLDNPNDVSEPCTKAEENGLHQCAPQTEAI